MSKLSLFKIPFIVVFTVIILDQLVKFWVKTTMYIGQEHPIFGNWFIIHFTENDGMAFGMSFGGNYGKLALSLFRIIAVFIIGYFIYKISTDKAHRGFIIAMSLIFAGALGNIVDSVFYGLVFSDSIFQVAQFLPPDGGYSTFLHGRVVDMLYFPLIEGHFPNWCPLWGGEEFIFFRPVFNIADSAISVGVAMILIFQKIFFRKK